MSFDDRLRDELRQATDSHPLDTESALRRVKSTQVGANAPTGEPVVVALEDVEIPRRRRLGAQRLAGVAAAIVVLAAGIAVPLALHDRSHNPVRHTTQKKLDPKKLDTKKPGLDPAAWQAVASALDATTTAGSFNVAYSLTETPATTPTTTTCRSDYSPEFNGPIGYTGSPGASPTGSQGDTRTAPTHIVCGYTGMAHNVTTTGSATVNVNPFAMIAVSDVSSFGHVTVRVDDTNYWESGDPAVLPTGAGSPLSSFSSLVESTLGPREGAGAMMGLASPTGYLSITRDAITAASKVGESTVDGAAVTVYRVAVDPSLLAKVPGLSSEESTTINRAIGVLETEGFTGNTTDVSIDARGFIVRTRSVNHFADGGTTIGENTFSAFGCAGAVQLPGRPVAPPPAETTCAFHAGSPTGPTGPTGAP